MKQENQQSNMLVRLLGSAVLATIIAILGLSWAIYSTRSEDKAWQQQFDSQATQIANQREQIGLNAEQNRLLYERATLDAEKANIESQLQTPFPSNDGDFAITATALSIQASQVAATQHAIDVRQQQIVATQTSLARTQATPIATNLPRATLSGAFTEADANKVVLSETCDYGRSALNRGPLTPAFDER